MFNERSEFFFPATVDSIYPPRAPSPPINKNISRSAVKEERCPPQCSIPPTVPGAPRQSGPCWVRGLPAWNGPLKPVGRPDRRSWTGWWSEARLGAELELRRSGSSLGPSQ